VLAAADRVTVLGDRENDILAYWAMPPQPNFHLLARMMRDRGVAGGGTVWNTTAHWRFVATRRVKLSATPGRAARTATLGLRFGEVEIVRPKGKDTRRLPKTVKLRLVEVVESDPPAGVEPVHWRLLTTHAVDDVAMARQIVDWYRLRWEIDIDQAWRLSRFSGRHGIGVGEPRRAAAPRRGRGSDFLQRRHGGGIGVHQYGATRRSCRRATA
jgi:hypothetical protein